ncbi:MAG: hypothetical protein V3S01_09305 [Dehalococcoidia bacterium]
MFKNLMAVMAILLMAAPMAAATPALGTPVCVEGGTCVADGGTRILLERTNSADITWAVIFIPTGTTNDTGTEVAALLNLTCVDVIDLDSDVTATASADELVDGTCATDIADGDFGLMMVR